MNIKVTIKILMLKYKNWALVLVLLCLSVAIFYGFYYFYQKSPPFETEDMTSQNIQIPAYENTKSSEPEENELPSEEQDKSLYEVTLKIEKGDTLMSLLTGAQINKKQAYDIIELLKKHFAPKDLKPRHEIYVTFVPDAQDPTKKVFESLYFRPSIDTEFQINLNKQNELVFEKHDVKLNRITREARGVIQDSLYQDARKEGVPIKILHKMIQAYSYDVDFQRSFQPGDRYGLLYTMRADEEGLREEPGELLYATLTLKNKKLHLYYFKNKEGSGEFYNQHGDSVKKGLLRTPIDGARISSGFGNRKHPILGYTKLHKGIDFAAPVGTPIMASGDGTVTQIGPYANYGNYIKIRHNGEFSTAYAHLSRFVKGLTVGKKVKQGQIIGYVGATGATTGPHLHYELIRGQTQINPGNIKMMPSGKLTGKNLQSFKIMKDLIDRQYSQTYLFKIQQVEEQAELEDLEEDTEEINYDHYINLDQI